MTPAADGRVCKVPQVKREDTRKSQNISFHTHQRINMIVIHANKCEEHAARIREPSNFMLSIFFKLMYQGVLLLSPLPYLLSSACR